ncbi:MAG: hypothetical protein WC069_01870 [Candidatus Shapirobacteria bacterium]
MQPFPIELKKICKENPSFEDALKSVHPERFVSLGAIVTSQCPLVPEDEIIGFFVYDYRNLNKPIFKQDFIVNIGKKNKEFILYTKYPRSYSKTIKDISEFFKKYPTYNKKDHHPKYRKLPDLIKPRAKEAIRLANNILKFGLRTELTDDEFNQFDLDLKKFGL